MEKGMPPPPPPGFGPPPPPPGFGPPPPPPPPYHQTQPQPQVVVVTSSLYGSEPQRLTCPYCNQDIMTEVETASNLKTHLFALLLCVFGLWCCAPCPYCIDSCLVKKHYCPSCKRYLGEGSN